MALIPKVLVVSNLPGHTPIWDANIPQRLNIVLKQPDKAIRHWAEILPDLVIVECEAEAPAIELITKFRDEASIPVLMLSSICSDKFILNAYQAGVDEYILKPIQPALLQAKIKAWLRRSGNVSVGLLGPLSFGNGKLIPEERSIQFADRVPVHLTALELRLLHCLIGRRGYTVTTEELCQRIWGESGGDAVSLKNVVYRLRRKIEVDPANPQYLLTVPGVGYQFRSA